MAECDCKLRTLVVFKMMFPAIFSLVICHHKYNYDEPQSQLRVVIANMKMFEQLVFVNTNTIGLAKSLATITPNNH